jgi:hypothetical protein
MCLEKQRIYFTSRCMLRVVAAVSTHKKRRKIFPFFFFPPLLPPLLPSLLPARGIDSAAGGSAGLNQFLDMLPWW